MSWLLSLGISLLTGLIALVPSGFAAEYCTRWFEVSEREGGRGYAVIFLALLGFVGGCVIGLVVSRLVASSSQPGGWRALGFSVGAVFLTLGLITGYSYLVTEHPPKIDGEYLSLEVEIRLPVTRPRPRDEEVEAVRLRLSAAGGGSSRGASMNPAKLRSEDGQWILGGSVFLHTRSPGRTLSVSMPNPAKECTIPIALAGRPTRADEAWTNWRPLDADAPSAAGKPKETVMIRTRMSVDVPPPPAVVESRSDPDVAAFNALTMESPIEDWMRFTVNRSSEREATALRVIAQRLPELEKIILQGDPAAAGSALRVAAAIKNPPAALATPVREIGRRLGADLARVLAAPDGEAAAEKATDAFGKIFEGWYTAVVSLDRARQLEGTAEFQPLFDVAARRRDHPLAAAVIRVTGFYLDDWARERTPSPASK